MSQQQRTELRAPLLGRLVEGREGPLVRGVHTRVVLYQEGGDVHVLQGGGENQRTVINQTAKTALRWGRGVFVLMSAKLTPYEAAL